jgi:hypothetical protein
VIRVVVRKRPLNRKEAELQEQDIISVLPTRSSVLVHETKFVCLSDAVCLSSYRRCTGPESISRSISKTTSSCSTTSLMRTLPILECVLFSFGFRRRHDLTLSLLGSCTIELRRTLWRRASKERERPALLMDRREVERRTRWLARMLGGFCRLSRFFCR